MQFLITSFNKKDGIKTNMIFYLTRPLLLGEAPHPLLNPPLCSRWHESCECLCAEGAHAE